MKTRIKNVLKKNSFIAGIHSKYKYMKHLRAFKKNCKSDYELYKKYSLAFSMLSFENKEASFIIQYHALEKGMLYSNMKNGFGQFRVEKLHKLLQDETIKRSVHLSQIKIGIQVLCKYYELHELSRYDISNFFTKNQYDSYVALLGERYIENFEGVYTFDFDDFYKGNLGSFDVFSDSRKSIRNFTGDLVDVDLIRKAVELANNAPSVCNRQASRVYLLSDKMMINSVLEIQGGFHGYIENVNQLLILTCDRSAFYTIGERNQLFVDGGIYLMNLLYSLHFYKIANCPANWGKRIDEEKELDKIINLPESEKIICMIPIGIAEKKFRTTLSMRRDINENFTIL